MILAVVEMGMSPKEFWSLTWYDWSLYLMRFNKQVENRKLQREIEWSHTRALMAVISNASPNRGEKTFKPEDFMRLSFDDPEVLKKEGPDPDGFRKMKEKYGSKIKRKNGKQ